MLIFLCLFIFLYFHCAINKLQRQTQLDDKRIRAYSPSFSRDIQSNKWYRDALKRLNHFPSKKYSRVANLRSIRDNSVWRWIWLRHLSSTIIWIRTLQLLEDENGNFFQIDLKSSFALMEAFEISKDKKGKMDRGWHTIRYQKFWLRFCLTRACVKDGHELWTKLIQLYEDPS